MQSMIVNKIDSKIVREREGTPHSLPREFSHQMGGTEDSMSGQNVCENYKDIKTRNKEDTDTNDKENVLRHNNENGCVRELKRLNLIDFYPNKLTLMDVMEVRDMTHSLEMTNIALHVAMKIIMINYTARDELLLKLAEGLQEQNKNPSHESFFDHLIGGVFSDYDESMSINPSDLFLAIFKCSSPMLQQVLAVKMFKCKLAIPFLHPSFDIEPDLLTLWPLRSIMIEYKNEKGSLEHTSLDCSCHVVSFIRLGRPSVSKSKLTNEIISDQYHNTFFNKDCPLGTTNRVLSEGMVEACWYLPSTKPPGASHFDNVTMFLNLRGDGKGFTSRLHNLSLISNVLVVLLHIDELFEDQSYKLIRSFCLSQSKVCLAVDAGMYELPDLKKKIELFSQQIQTFKQQLKLNMVTMNGQMRSISTVKSELRRNISDLANESDYKDLTLSERVLQYQGKVDEQEEIYKKAKRAATEVMGHMKSTEADVKTEVVPLQGKTWQTWSDKMKRSNKASLYKTIEEHGKLQIDMEDERRKQAEMCRKMSPVVSLFLNNLKQFVSCENECLVFILFLKQMLDERSRKILPGYHSDFQACWKIWKIARDENENPDVIKNLREKFDKSEQRLAEASFGFEHFCREMGQIYESLKKFPPTSEPLKQLYDLLPVLAVQLLIMGQPFEIMDGDVANVPLEWVAAVFKTLKKTIGDKKMLTLSVLGIQSSGKSTLLNTMFGLQFAVSAGRCTRGVYMQLVPVRRKNSPFDYLMVIDTEGLRAPELAHQKHSHDNELATFVIGLGDITIVNIKGENTAEIKDVLQIAVHASIRLKLANARLNLRKSCVFVHQNVAAFDANDKMMQGRQKFVEELDMMTKEAANQEHISDIQSFNQVIEFDSETNVWYFSDLWRGDPPMAPANPGYSDSVADVKESIVTKISATRSTYLTITDTLSRVKDLWNGIVKDDFVFSFRNSLELKAYTSLEQMCHDVSWKLEKYVLEFGQTKAKSRLVMCNDRVELETTVTQLRIDLRNDVNDRVQKQIEQLDEFIEQSSLKDVMIQWVQNKRLRFTNNADTLIINATKIINNIRDEILVKYQTTKEKTKHEMEINELAKSLAIQMKGQQPDEKELESQFNGHWNSWIKDLPSSTQINDIPIELQIESTLCEKFTYLATFIHEEKSRSNLKFYRDLRKLEDSLCETHVTEEHISIHKKWKVWKKDKRETCYRQTVDVINTIFRKIDNMMVDLSFQDMPFNIAYVTEILNIIVTGIDEHNNHENNDYKFNLLPPLLALLINHVTLYATVFFTKQSEDYNNKHSPKAQMEQYKKTAWILFKSTVQNKADEVIAVGLFKEAILKALAEHIDNLIPIDVSDLIINNFGNGKHGLIVEMLIELANDEKFENYFKFVKDPNSCAKEWLTKLMQKKLFKTTMKKQTMYAFLVDARSQKIFEEIQLCIESSSESFNGNITDWIDQFVSKVNATDNFPLSAGMFVHVQNTSVKDIQAFVDLLNDEMVGAKEEFLTSYKKTTWSTVQWKESPMSTIMTKLWGCTAFCMFCHEPCKEMNPGHWDEDKQPHRCVQHRPSGLKGFRNTATQVMCIEFCNYYVGSNETYVIGEHKGPYKGYKNHYPSWDILPNANASDYWKWVTCKFQQEFLDKYDMKEPHIPESWRSITKEKAIDSLSSLS